jgi:hypothetical protein
VKKWEPHLREPGRQTYSISRTSVLWYVQPFLTTVAGLAVLMTTKLVHI